MKEYNDSYLNEGNYRTYDEILRTLGVDWKKPGVRVLELGSGNAKFLDYLRKNGVNAVGVDIRPTGSVELPQITTRVEQLFNATESVDVVLSIQVFDNSFYQQNHLLMMQEIARVLKPGGIYIAHGEQIEIASVPHLTLVTELSEFGLQVYKKS